MTQLSGACWAVTDDPNGESGTVFDSVWVDAVEASIDALIHSATNPTLSPADTTDEVVEARGTFDTLNDRISAIVDIDGLPVSSAGSRGLSQTFRGIHLRTSPGAIDSRTKVELIRAREIVYNDGRSDAEDFTGIDSTILPLTADITVAGAGGLDTGAEENKWYEIYAIRNDVTGVQNLLLHLAPYVRIDLTAFLQVGDDGSHTLRRALAPLNTKLGQGFKLSEAGLIEAVNVTLIRTGAVVGSVWFTLEADVAGAPSGVALATSQIINAANVSTTAQVIRFTFRRPASFALATQYHLVLQGDYTASDTVHIGWRADTSAAPYGDGSKAFYDGAAWAADLDDDFIFSIYVTTKTNITMPADYTQYCLLGYVLNSALDTHFVPFIAFDRKVTYLGQKILAAGTASATPILTNLGGLVPPGLILVSPVVSCATNAGDVCVGPVPDGIAQTSDEHRHNGAVRFKNPAGSNTIKVELAPILTQYQACYLSSAAGVAFDTWLGMWEWF